MILKTLIKLLPLRCELCHLELSRFEKSKLQPWCDICKHSLPRNPRCLTCGLPTIEDTILCGRCIKKPPAWHRLYCIDIYQFPYDKLIHRLKYQGHFWLANNFTDLLIKEIDSPASMLLPVPMHWQRRIFRGYNHSQILALQLAKKLNAVCNDAALKRKRATKQQQGLSRKERLTNLKNAFEITQTLPKHIALIDDVVTTGTTINEICKILKKNGVEKIDVYCIARSSGEKI